MLKRTTQPQCTVEHLPAKHKKFRHFFGKSLTGRQVAWCRMRRILRSALPAWLMLGALGLSLVVVHYAAIDDEVETVMLQRVKKARFMSLMKAEGPIQNGESPPFVSVHAA